MLAKINLMDKIGLNIENPNPENETEIEYLIFIGVAG